MNTSEHIVESYFRFCRNCFTITDKKVKQAQNRQFDILAYDLKNNSQMHIEVATTTTKSWEADTKTPEFKEYIEKKFFGTPPKRETKEGNRTDYERGVNYLEKISDAYKEVSFDFNKVERIIVFWSFKKTDGSNFIHFKSSPEKLQDQEKFKKEYQITLISLRDFIIPELFSHLKTSNYEDEILRTFSFLNEIIKNKNSLDILLKNKIN